MRVMVLVLLVACGGGDEELQPDAGVLPADAISGDVRTDLYDDGFGFGCKAVYDGTIGTECTTSSGLVGWCVVDVCRRKCDSGRACPRGQIRVPLAGVDRCACEPRRCLQGLGTEVCQVTQAGG